MAETTEMEPTVHVVDDDEAVRDSLRWLICSVNLNVETYASAAEFLDNYQDGGIGCLVTDVRMPGQSGMDLQKEMKARAIRLPVIIITGHGDVDMAVRAMKEGAFDFVEKPFNDQDILDIIQKAVDRGAKDEKNHIRQVDVMKRLDRLTPRERQVLGMIVAGESNKGVAHHLGISDKTVEAHRAKVMEKMEARSLAELMKTVMVLEAY